MPSEPPRPAKPRGLPARPSPADQQRYQRDMQNYQDRMDRYEQRIKAYRKGIDDTTDTYKAAMKDYAARMEDWQKARTKVAAVDGMMESVYDKCGQAFRGKPETRWLAMAAIMVVVFADPAFPEAEGCRVARAGLRGKSSRSHDRIGADEGRDKPGDAAWGRERRPVANVSLKDACSSGAWL